MTMQLSKAEAGAEYVGSVNTVDATVTTCLVMTMPANKSWTVEVQVAGRRTGGSAGAVGDSAGIKLFATFTNPGGVAAIVGTVTIAGSHLSQAGWAATMDVVGSTCRVRVNGAANNNVMWIARAKVMEA